MAEEFLVRQLANGMTILGQRMEQVASAAMTFSTPAGSSHESDDDAGAVAVAGEWLFRGAGGRDTRQINDALDALGCQHHENIHSEQVQLATAQLGRNLPQVLEIYADVLRRPMLDESTFEPCRTLTLQDLASLEDEPAHKCNLMLREKFYPYPLGRSLYGTAQSLSALTPARVREEIRQCLSPHGLMMSVAGSFDWAQVCELVDKYFADWSAPQVSPVRPGKAHKGVTHVHKESAQAHIALAHRAAAISEKGYYPARLAETVLSGGMSGRLFTEVREKRGLVYHVSTRYHSLKHHAGMFTYAGTTPEKAQQTLDVTVGEIRRLADGIQPEEMARARTQLKSSLIMQGESTGARANALVSDWYHLGRLRSLAEIHDAIEKVTIQDVLDYLHEYPARDFTVLVVGPEPLNVTAISE